MGRPSWLLACAAVLLIGCSPAARPPAAPAPSAAAPPAATPPPASAPAGSSFATFASGFRQASYKVVYRMSGTAGGTVP